MIVHVIDNLEPGGAQTLLLELASRIPDTCVFCLRGPADSRADRWVSAYCSEMQKGQRWRPTRGLLRLVQMCVTRRRIALFVAHLDASTIALCLLKPILKLKLMVMVHASPQQWPYWYRIFFRAVIGFADLVIAGGERHRRDLVNEGVPPERIVLVGIGSTLFDHAPQLADRDIRAELGILSSAPVLLNVARMVPGKGQAEILRAMALLSRTDVVAVIVGDGPEEARLRRLARELGVEKKVVFAGRRTDLHNFYAVARAFLMPCLDESMGVAVLEALAYRVPVIAYNSGNIGEFIEDGRTGFLIAPDVATLVRTIERVLRQRPLLDFSNVGRFSMSAMVERFRAILEQQGATSGR